MTPDQINAAIAQACGWKWHGEATYGGIERSGWWKGDVYSPHGILNYHSDLNACAEMEAMLTEEQTPIYRQHLQEMFWFSLHSPTPAISATAPQRCEAFLRTKGLWK